MSPVQLLITCNMWQSQVEIEHYSVAYFDWVTVFETLRQRSSFKGKIHMHCVDSWMPDIFIHHIHMYESQP